MYTDDDSPANFSVESYLANHVVVMIEVDAPVEEVSPVLKASSVAPATVAQNVDTFEEEIAVAEVAPVEEAVSLAHATNQAVETKAVDEEITVTVETLIEEEAPTTVSDTVEPKAMEEESAVEEVVLVEGVLHASVAEDAEIQDVEVELAPTESTQTESILVEQTQVENTRNCIGFPHLCQTDSVSAAHVAHLAPAAHVESIALCTVESSNGFPVPVPQIDLIPGLMDLKQINTIKSGLFCFILDAPTGFLVVASTSLRQMLPTLKFSSSGLLGGTQIHVSFAAL